ncbi:DUF805 domain-containing protein [Chitinibacter sp. SCUT-21]|uniref:DUF805 domain-containing protein n=1 Tax=Chitinibacter sp. SCUT-21 TaxID=2970891 RepID=UPI0035A683E7
MSAIFRLVLTGNFLPGVETEQATAALAKLLRLEIERTQALLLNAPTVIKKALPQHQLDTYLKLFHQAGVEVTAVPITPSAPAESSASIASPETNVASRLEQPLAIAPLSLEPAIEQMTCPQCGKVQAKRTLCLGCGADMPRMLAAQAQAAITEAPIRTESVRSSTAPSPRRSRQEPEYETPAFWSLSTEGRLGRMRYFCNGLLSILPLLAAMIFAFAIGKGEMTLVGVIIFIGAIVWCVVQNYRMMVFRLHDLNKPTKYAGWIIVGQIAINAATGVNASTGMIIVGSLISLIVYGALAFAPGDDGENDYGLPAEPPYIFHYIASFICGIAIVGTIIQTASMDSPAASAQTPSEAALALSDEDIDELIAQVEQQSGEKLTREEARQRIKEHYERQSQQAE